jgi:hypothetical protein
LFLIPIVRGVEATERGRRGFSVEKNKAPAIEFRLRHHLGDNTAETLPCPAR